MNFDANINHNILIIENDVSLTTLLRSVFIKSKYDVSSEFTLEKAKNNVIAHEFNYDIILIDYNLPDGNANHFITWLKPQAPRTSIIVMSADNSDSIVISCFKAGAHDFIVKPIEIPKVLSLVKSNIQEIKFIEPTNEINAQQFTSDWIELTANSQIEYLSRIQKLCTALLSSKLKSTIVDDIRLAMEEYGRNAIEWGNKFDKSKIFKISYCLFDDRVILKFEDEGEGFDFKSLPDPSKNPAEHLKSRESLGKRPGGYGIFMMKQIMDETIYSEKGNVCVMTKYIKK